MYFFNVFKIIKITRKRSNWNTEYRRISKSVKNKNKAKQSEELPKSREPSYKSECARKWKIRRTNK